MMANEVRELTPALLGGKNVSASVSAAVSTSVTATGGAALGSLTTGECASGIRVKAWLDRDGSTVVVAANTNNADGPPCMVTFEAGVGPLGATDGPSPSTTCSVSSMFENRYIAKSVSPSAGGTVSFVDGLRGFSTAAYRIECPSAAAATKTSTMTAAANMVYNGGYEISVNPATPDGNYVSQAADPSGGGFFFTEYRDSVAGHASLRLTAPKAGTGVSLAPYTVARVTANANYTFSVWVKGKGAVSFSFNKKIWPLETAGARIVQATVQWTKTSITLLATSDPTKACQYNCRSWLNYGLASAGDVWLDELTLAPSAA